MAFELARRHRFVGDLAKLPPEVEVHVLPTGDAQPARFTDPAQFRYRDTARTGERIAQARAATARYLEDEGL